MALINLATPQLSTHPRRLPSAPHWGGTWKFTVATLRAAIREAMCNARIRPQFTANRVGSEVIDLVDQLDGFALAVLHVVIGELARQSKKGDHRW